ncbi:hypothetical protein AUC61_07745 [Pseudomonas sp. S25]|uniref:Uncharacterized protein n=1 Tax=Pseudomonas maioricensis TaxID=1766623 RepID=A0ABS9ZFR3_9PSED|nr:hypothetical protein [Pseudomonas sp. S25]MCI8209424.1 hypothetical protein [Pseudomonas sp. S25]
MTNKTEALVLHRRTRNPNPASLHSREIELRVADDGRHVLLSRYVELFSQDDAAWCTVRHHRVPLASMIRWMISHGVEGEGSGKH